MKKSKYRLPQTYDWDCYIILARKVHEAINEFGNISDNQIVEWIESFCCNKNDVILLEKEFYEILGNKDIELFKLLNYYLCSESLIRLDKHLESIGAKYDFSSLQNKEPIQPVEKDEITFLEAIVTSFLFPFKIFDI